MGLQITRDLRRNNAKTNFQVMSISYTPLPAPLPHPLPNATLPPTGPPAQGLACSVLELLLLICKFLSTIYTDIRGNYE